MTVQRSGYLNSTKTILYSKLPQNVFMILGMPYLVYIREAREEEMNNAQLFLESYDAQVTKSDESDVRKRFAIFAANGECLAVTHNRMTAIAWAKENNLSPQSVH